MKRATKRWLESFEHVNGLSQDALDSDARQRAELRRLRKIERAVGTFLRLSEDWAYHWILEEAALKPARRKP